MYKDKDKQKEAGKERQRRYRDKLKPRPEVTPSGNVRVSKPSDADYIPQCETTRAFVEGRPKKEIKTYADLPEHVKRAVGEMPLDTYVHRLTKRGKDIKVFEDLPPDVQQTIRRMSDSNEEFQRRIGIAIRYQHLFPRRYHSTGAAL